MTLQGRGKRKKGRGNYGVLATRKPKWGNLPAGAPPTREDARQSPT
jgi:hypothetical protein